MCNVGTSSNKCLIKFVPIIITSQQVVLPSLTLKSHDAAEKCNFIFINRRE